jgi:hypothetical protein
MQRYIRQRRGNYDLIKLVHRKWNFGGGHRYFFLDSVNCDAKFIYVKIVSYEVQYRLSNSIWKRRVRVEVRLTSSADWGKRSSWRSPGSQGWSSRGGQQNPPTSPHALTHKTWTRTKCCLHDVNLPVFTTVLARLKVCAVIYCSNTGIGFESHLGHGCVRVFYFLTYVVCSWERNALWK